MQYYLVISGQAISGGGMVGMLGSVTKVRNSHSTKAKPYLYIIFNLVITSRSLIYLLKDAY